MKALICSPETRGQFTGIINRQICHKWFHCCTNYKFKPHLITCFFIPPLPPLCWVVFDVFIIIIKQIVFFWYDCYRRWQGKETQLRSQSFILGDTLQLLTPLPRTGMFSKIWRAILVEVAGPEAPHWMILQPHISFEQSYIFTKLHPQKGLSYIWLVKWNLQAPPLTIPLPI